MLKPGKYAARPVEHHFSQSSTGKDQIVVRLQIGEDHISWFGYFTDQTIKRTVESLEYMGYDGGSLDDMVLDQEVQVELVMDNYQGKDRLKVAWINKPGGNAKPVENMSALEKRIQAASSKKPGLGF